LDLRHCDRPNVADIHGFHGVRGLLARGATSTSVSGVPGKYDNVYFETTLANGISVQGGVLIAPRVEVGYSAVIGANVGSSTLPTAVLWSITGGSGTITFNPATWQTVGGTLYDATYYFLPYTFIRLTDSTGYTHRLFVINVSANSIDVATLHVNFHSTISGNG